MVIFALVWALKGTFYRQKGGSKDGMRTGILSLAVYGTSRTVAIKENLSRNSPEIG
jgi:hypothetical protein